MPYAERSPDTPSQPPIVKMENTNQPEAVGHRPIQLPSGVLPPLEELQWADDGGGPLIDKDL